MPILVSHLVREAAKVSANEFIVILVISAIIGAAVGYFAFKNKVRGGDDND